MRDLVMLAVIAAFFALCVVYVRWCDHIIGPDADLPDDGTAADLVQAESTQVSA